MRRFSRSHLLSSFLLILTAALVATGCGGGGGGSTGPGPITTVTISPTPTASVDNGDTIGFSATGKDAAGTTVFGTVTWASSNPAVQIANNGLVCAGKWDSLSTPVVCTPVPPASMPAQSQITATINGVTSATPTTLFVHEHIDNITLTPSITYPAACLSQTQTQQYTATAFAGAVDITATVGPFNFVVLNTNIATIAAADQPAGQPTNQITAKAKNPGMTSVVASNSGTTSLGADFTTCGAANISLHVTASTDTAFTIATGATKQLAADVTDVNGNTITGLTLTYSTTNIAAPVSSTGLVTGTAPGQATISASCSPPSCNPGVNIPVYSNPVVATVTGTAAASTVYVTSSEFTTQTPVILPISTSSNTVGTGVALADVSGVKTVPNSMLFSTNGTRLFIGSNNGLVLFDPATNAVVGSVTNLPGKVISLSPSGEVAIVADSGAGNTYVYNTVTNVIDTLAGVATAAAWTSDGLKAYIVAGSTLYQYSTAAISLRTIPIGDTGTGAGMLPGNQFAYIGTNGGSMGARATCRNDSTYVPEATVATDVGTQFLAGVALNGGTSAVAKMLNVGGATMTVDTPAITAPGAGDCPPGIATSVATANWGGFGIAAFTPRQLIPLPNGSKAYVTSDQTVLLGYNVGTNTSYTVAIGATDTWTGGALRDGSRVYVGGSDGAVHVIDTATDLQNTLIPITFNGTTSCAGTVCRPNLVAVRP